ncbi:hypothetical protein EDE04_0117 [Streptomyces sp. 2132.2]|nr:hypothetical protein EDE04_0117 [Streptomyces sp. 2132.2]
MALITEPDTANTHQGVPGQPGSRTAGECVPGPSSTRSPLARRPPKRKTQPRVQLRMWWQMNAILNSGVESGIITSLRDRGRPAAMAIRARAAQLVDVALAALDVTRGRVRDERRRLVPPPVPARRSTPPPRLRPPRPTSRCRPGRPGRGRRSRHCLDISEPKTVGGCLMSDHLLYTARRALVDAPPTRRRHPTATPDPDQPLPAAPATATRPRCRWRRGSGTSPASRCATTGRSSPPPCEQLRHLQAVFPPDPGSSCRLLGGST